MQEERNTNPHFFFSLQNAKISLRFLSKTYPIFPKFTKTPHKNTKIFGKKQKATYKNAQKKQKQSVFYIVKYYFYFDLKVGEYVALWVFL